MEGELFSSKQIIRFLIYDYFNSSKIMDHILNVKHILNSGIDYFNKETSGDFNTYYKYKAQFLGMVRYQIVEVPADPITSKKKMRIYTCFI